MHEIEPSTNPFEAIRREDHQGEHWIGRELAPLMGYGRHDAFLAIIEKAKAALALIAGAAAAESNFLHIQRNPSGVGRPGADYRLTRFAAYLTAMAGDDTKKAIALARIYFAVKTREAEVGIPQQREPMDELELAEYNVQLIKDKRALLARAMQAEQTLAIAAPKADAWDDLASAEGDYAVREAAHILNRDPAITTGQNRLFKTMRELGMIDRNDIPYQTHERHVRLRPRKFYDHNGAKRLEDQVRVTVNGLSYLHKKMGGTMRFSQLIENTPDPEMSIALPAAPEPLPEQEALFEVAE